MQNKKAAKAIAIVGFAALALDFLFIILENIVLSVLDAAGVNLNFLLTDKAELLITLLSYLFVMLPTVIIAKKCVSAECGEEALSAMLPSEHVGAGKFILAVLTCYAFCFVGNYISMKIADFAAENALPVPSSGLTIYSDPALFVLQLLMIAVLPAMLEELLVRGTVCYYCNHLGPTCCGIMSGVFFALFHNNVAQYPIAFLFGFITGYFVCAYKNIWIGITAHLFNNLLSLSLGFCPDNKVFIAGLLLLLIIAVSLVSLVIMTVRFSLFRDSVYHDSFKQLRKLFAEPVFAVFIVLSVAVAVLELVI